MALIPSYKKFIILSGGGSDIIDLTSDFYDQYLITSGSVTLVSSYSITATGTPIEGMTLLFSYQGNITLSSNNITILGRQLSQEEANSNLYIVAIYNSGSSSWEVTVSKDNNSGNYESASRYTIPNGGGTTTLVSGINPQVLILDGSPSLSSNYTVTGTASKIGDSFIVYYTATPTLNGNTITIFGIALPDFVATNGAGQVTATWDGTTWVAQLNKQATSLTQISDLSDEANTYQVNLEITFEESTVYQIYPYTGFKIEEINYIVTHTLSGTDAGHITFALENGMSTISPTPSDTITIPLSTIKGTSGNITFTGSNIGIDDTWYLFILSAKITGGAGAGKAFLSIKLIKQ